MEFEQFINEKLSDDLTTDQLDNYWKTIHLYNAWKKNQKNSQKLKNMLAFILDNYNLDDRAREKISSLLNIVKTYMETGDMLAAPVKHREEKEETQKEVEVDEADYNQIEVDQEFLEKAFDKFNQKYFDGKLAKIPLKLLNSKSNCGQFAYHTDMSAKRMVPEFISMNTAQPWTLSTFRNTLVHEMLHYYVHCYVGFGDKAEEVWTTALYWAIRRNIRKVRSILESSDATCHSGRWLKLAKELNHKFPELAITRNVFLPSSTTNANKLEVIKQLKDAYVVKIILTNFGKPSKRYRIASSKDLEKLIDILKPGELKLDWDKDPLERFILSFGLTTFGGENVIEAAKILNPVSVASFPIDDLNEQPFYLGKEMFKQINDTKALGKFKEVAKAKIDYNPKKKDESTEQDFKTWLNEKTTKAWDIEKLKALGMTDEEIEKLLSGEYDEMCEIS